MPEEEVFNFRIVLFRPHKIFLVFSLVLVGLFLIYPTVNAAGLVPCGRLQDDKSTPDVNEMKPCTTCDLFALASRVINFVLFTVVPAVAVLFYLIGGFMILLSRGSPGLVATGRNFFWNTTWGLVIIFGAWMITNTVLKSIVGDNDISKNWFRIECTATVQQPPPTQRYTCGSLSCIPKSDGEYTEPTCDKKCAPAPKKYSCKDDQCVLDYAGSHTSSDCDDECLAEEFYTCDENNQCVEDPEGEYDTLNCDNECAATGGPLTVTTASLPDAVVGTKYSATLAVSGGKTPYTFTFVSGGTLPPGTLFGNGVFSGTPATAGTYTFSIKVVDSSSPAQSVTKEFSIKVVAATALQCPGVGTNLCQASTSCPTNACGQYSSAIQQAANKISIPGLNTKALIASIMFGESSCNVSAYNKIQNPDGSYSESCGPMQMQIGTARDFQSQCGITTTITCDWLRNPANINQTVCLGAKYIESLARGRCGSNVRHIAAGYNGGSGYCGVSRDCDGEKNCDGQPMKAWECPYDNETHTLCNTICVTTACNTDRDHPGFLETRKYAPAILACYNKQ